MTSWEYLIVSLPPFEAARSTQGHSPAVAMLDREGRAGWEAVSLSTLQDGSVAVLLKRPCSDRVEVDEG